MTGAEMFDDLCRKAGLPTMAEDLAAAQTALIEGLLSRFEQDRQAAEFWRRVSIAPPSAP